MTALVPRPRDGGPPAPREGGCWCLETERQWILEGEPRSLDALQTAVPQFTERLSDRVLILSFRNAVGRLTLPALGDVELISGKWTEADFDRLLREVTQTAAALPFSREMGSGSPYERVALPDQPIPFHAFVYLRYALSPATPWGDRLDLALRRIVKNPHRRLVEVHPRVPLELARSVGTRGLVRLLGSPSTWQPVPRGVGGALATALGGHLPERVEEDRRASTVDTVENRFVKAFLSICHQILERTERSVTSWESEALRERIRSECAGVRRALLEFAAHPLWQDVGTMLQFPASSSVLQRRSGYKEVLRHFIRLRLVSRIPIEDEHALDLLGLKDIATLYEIWCFFALVRELEHICGPPATAETPVPKQGQLTVPWGLRVRWFSGVEAWYNARFAQGTDRESTSVPLRPDIALVVPHGPSRGLHLLDAKFRLRWRDLLSDDDSDAATFKKADLYKMHTYRDAIPGARSVWVLYPGTEKAFFPAHAGGAGLDGVGAIPAVPGGLALQELLAELLTTEPMPTSVSV